MRLLATTTLLSALLALAPAPAQADLSNYSQNFETMNPALGSALADDGWLVFGNVFSPDFNTYFYGYGPFPAPNPGGGFSAVAVGQGGPAQGAQQLSVYSDYNNGDHAVGNQIESNVFKEQVIGAADVGTSWNFTFDAKLGNLEAPTTALAFIKTLDPNSGFATTNFITVDMTSIGTAWGTYFLGIAIDPSLAGQILQFGFASTASNYKGSGVFYDNVGFSKNVPVSTRPATWSTLKKLYR